MSDLDFSNQNPDPRPQPPDPPDPPRPRFPQWRPAEEDLWVELLWDYSVALIDPDMREDDALAKVRLAALLADEAIKEMQYRFHIQRPPKRAKAARRTTQTQAPAPAGKGSRSGARRGE